MGAGVPGMEMQEEGGRMGVKMSGRTAGATRRATQGRVNKNEGTLLIILRLPPPFILFDVALRGPPRGSICAPRHHHSHPSALFLHLHSWHPCSHPLHAPGLRPCTTLTLTVPHRDGRSPALHACPRGLWGLLDTEVELR